MLSDYNSNGVRFTGQARAGVRHVAAANIRAGTGQARPGGDLQVSLDCPAPPARIVKERRAMASSQDLGGLVG